MIHVQDAVLFEKLLCWDRRTKRMLCVHIVGLQAVADLAPIHRRDKSSGVLKG